MKNPITDNISPLRYPGSKQKIVTYLEQILAHNSLSPDLLIEPFVGGGSVFLKFLLHGIVDYAVISDRDRLIISFWKTVFTDPQYLINFVKNIDISIKNYYRYKKIITTEIDNIKTLAEACIYLNRTSFSGILKDNSGPIGGKKQSSEYKIDCRFNREVIADKIDYISKLKDRVIIKDYSWEKTITFSEDKYSKNFTIFYYFDPPFFYKGKGLYREYFKYDEHVIFSQFLHGFNSNWVLSYDNAEEIKQLYTNEKYKPVHIDAPYSINSRAARIEKEIIITPLEIPAIL